MVDKFKISVILTIFIRTDDVSTPIKCAFFDKNGIVYLPNAPVTYDKYAHQVAVNLVKELIPVNLKMIHILPIGFFDPISEKPTTEEREILLGYRVIIAPNMPVHADLEFKDNDEVRIAASRISKNHLRVFRAGLSA